MVREVFLQNLSEARAIDPRHKYDASGRRDGGRGGGEAAGLAPPDGSRPLAAHISGAKELSAALAGVGIVDSAAEQLGGHA